MYSCVVQIIVWRHIKEGTVKHDNKHNFIFHIINVIAIQGSTSTTNTGPSAAHSGNQYAYIEVDGQGEDFVALLSSQNTNLFCKY